MDKLQIADENMGSAVVLVLDDNNTIIAANQPIQDSKTVVKGILTDIDANALIQQETTKGATIEEYFARLDAGHIGEKFILGLKPYYLLHNDLTNLAMVDKHISDLIYGSRTESLHLMQLIHSKAVVIPIADLTPFGIVAQDVMAFGTAITKFENAMPKNRTILGAMKTATSELVRLFTDLKTELKKLDILMGPFKISNNEFWKIYTNARIIVNIGAGQTAEQAILQPLGFVPVFGNKLKPGYTVTFRNPNPFPVKLSLSNTPDQYSAEHELTIEANANYKIHIPEDFGGVFGNYMMIYNPNPYNKIKVTAILAKGASKSGAPELQGQVKPI